ncbi:putative ATPase [Ilumatobacter fluminis]|uniref:Putative ATPase n=1 Tax=Ilumatobacter fluminis TaxID=467091 RepID=A0A4R7I4J8_9ACTN|nr:tetratricopeptide repeat protein [Ilumatobacter fluminis]TDT18174.1 putative ATPase [Ilumatobacter fluminis]
MALIAREAELAELDDRLRRHRLVTIVGPGGIGKTTLARAAAAAALPRFDRGVGTVDLTRIDESAEIDGFIASQLGFPDFRSMTDSPDHRSLLVVVDNCEHVIEAAADAIDTMIGSCLSFTILCTSRTPLDLSDEAIVSLPPLDVPPPDLDDPSAASMRMLTERVVDLGGRITDDDVAAAAEICRRLDGVPLALELAAAHARTVPLGRVLDRLDARPADLDRRRFRGRSAHRSVVAAVEWSLQLLDDDTRRSFERLAVVNGPFDNAMAQAVVGDDRRPIDDLLDELVAASLLAVDTTATDTLYRMLRPLRAVALDRLGRDDDAVRDVESRIADHVVGRAAAVLLSSESDWADQLPRLLDGYDAMIAAQRWMLEHDDEPDRSLVLLAVFWAVVQQLHRAEVAEVGEQVLERWPDPTTPFWVDAAATVATCYQLLGRLDDAVALATTALEHADGSVFAPVTLRRALAQATRRMGRPEEARRWFAEGASVAAANVPGLARVLRVDEAIMLAELGDTDQATRVLDAIADEASRTGATINRAWAHCARATVAWLAADPTAAERARAAIDESRSIGYAAGELYSLRLLGAVLIDDGKLAAAASAVLELQNGLLERRAALDARAVLDHAARLLELHADDDWADLAATANRLDTTSTLTARDAADIVDRGSVVGRDLGVRDALELCRDRLTAMANDHDAPNVETAAAPPAGGPTLRCEGDVWRWTFDGGSVTTKASKGAADLARLLERPGHEVSALDLSGSTKMADSGIETLDSRARRETEDRIRELRADIDEADAHHDLARAERATAEMDRLVDELTSALGLGGRARRTGSDGERARSAVTQRIRSTIRRIDELHPKLGAHLSVSVETGTFCVYRPAEPVVWTVER